MASRPMNQGIFPTVPRRAAGAGSDPALDGSGCPHSSWVESARGRSPANLPRRGGWEPFEGIIETDRWFGPLITNLRLTKTNVPIDLQAGFSPVAGPADPAPRL